MDEAQLREEGVYSILGIAGARTEVPGCSLCMGNQARVADKATVFSTSTRNFDNRMGRDARVYLGSAELAAVCALLGHIPSVSEYLEIVEKTIYPNAGKIYQYLNFNRMPDYSNKKIIGIATVN
jgi:aconitate hydratase 2 / 2-methylisocitrate dehydratase